MIFVIIMLCWEFVFWFDPVCCSDELDFQHVAMIFKGFIPFFFVTSYSVLRQRFKVLENSVAERFKTL